MRGSKIAIAGVCLAFASAAVAGVPGKIYEVTYGPNGSIQDLADAGLDILEVRDGSAIVYMDAANLAVAETLGYDIEVEIDDVDAAIDAVREREPTTFGGFSYHTHASLNADLYALEASGIAKVQVIGQSLEGRDILAVKISDNPELDEPGEREGVLMGCHHAREWISVEVPFLIAQDLVNSYGSDPEVTSIVNDGVTWIVPMVNPDGHQYTVDVNRLWRKNRRDNGASFGVDLNRNYPSGWGGPGSSGSQFSDTYRGAAPASEPETQVVIDFVEAHDFEYLVTYHSYSQLILWPWGNTDALAPDHELLKRIGETMESLIEAVPGSANYVAQKSSELYLASGTTDDWYYDETRRPGFTIELRPVSAFPGFELPPSQIEPTFLENLPAAYYLASESQADSDSDTVNDLVDNCIDDANPGQEDDDGDGVGEVCDPFPGDGDNDGVPDVSDNCPDDPNPGQEDGDGDGIGDVCDGPGGGCKASIAGSPTEAPASVLLIAIAFGLVRRARRDEAA